jgi:hypothetical protein
MFKKLSVNRYAQESAQAEADKPKKTFAYGGGNSTFSQLMRQEMGKASD